MVEPTNTQHNTQPNKLLSQRQVYDLLIVGSGPAGLTPHKLSFRLQVLFKHASSSALSGRAGLERDFYA